jgi:hypothetical protein
MKLRFYVEYLNLLEENFPLNKEDKIISKATLESKSSWTLRAKNSVTYLYIRIKNIELFSFKLQILQFYAIHYFVVGLINKTFEYFNTMIMKFLVKVKEDGTEVKFIINKN